MTTLSLKELKEKSERNYEALKSRKRQAYKLARQLGFTPQEAQVLSGYSQERIIRLAQERRNGAI